MKLKKLILKNIRSHQLQEIDFPEGSTLLSGDIGSGKTSILLGIEYALFGLQPGQRGSSLLRVGEDNAEVSLEFEVDGQPFTVSRQLKRSSKGINQEGCSLKIGEVEEFMSTTELKTKILNILSYPAEFVKKTNLLYKYTVYSPQEEMKQIIIEDPEVRLNVLRHVFGIDKYKRIKENVSLVTAKLREQARTVQAESKDIERNKSDLESNEKTRQDLEKSIAEKQVILENKKSVRKLIEKEATEIDAKAAEKYGFEKELEKTNIMLSNKVQQIADNDKEAESIQKKLQELNASFDEEHYSAIINRISQKKLAISECDKKIIDLSAQIKSIESTMKDNLEKRERIFKIEICPTCLQDVSDGHKHNILNATEKNVSESKKNLTELSSELKSLELIKEKESKEMQILEKAKSDLETVKIRSEGLEQSRTRLETLRKTQESLNKDVQILSKHLTSLKETILKFSTYENLSKIKRDDLRKAFKEEKEIEISLAEIKKEKEFIEKEIKKINEIISEKEKIKEKSIKIQQVEQWLSGDFTNLVSSIERNLLMRLREEFSKLFNKWFAMLTSESFFARLDENFTPIILQRGYELDYSFLSGGERTAVALAYRLALNQLINSLLSKIGTKDLIILDEPTDGFSDEQLNKVRDILDELKTGQVILVSHEQKIEGFVDSIIRLTKEDGTSLAVKNS